MTACPKCGTPLKPPRSGPDHKRFFSLVNAAFTHWKSTHDFEPDNPEHLRAWLLCRAGYCEKTPIECPVVEDNPAIAKLIALACEGVMRASKGRGFIKVYGDRIIVYSPKSISWDKLDQKAFNEIRERVTGVIESELGVDAEQLLKETENAA
jgi:hypothetical protein